MRTHFTRHARVRMAEMNVPPTVVEEILLRPAVTRPADSRGADDCYLAVSDEHPEHAVIYYRAQDGAFVVVSVVFRTYEKYERNGTGFLARAAR